MAVIAVRFKKGVKGDLVHLTQQLAHEISALCQEMAAADTGLLDLSIEGLSELDYLLAIETGSLISNETVFKAAVAVANQYCRSGEKVGISVNYSDVVVHTIPRKGLLAFLGL